MSAAVSETIQVLPAGAEHLEAVLRIESAVQPRPWSREAWRRELRDGTRIYRVAFAGGTQVGHAGLMAVPATDGDGVEGHVTTVSVDPAHHGRGIATCLMLALHREALARGIRALTLEVRPSNERAIRLYRRFGYAPAGVRRGYFVDHGEDGLVMWAHDVGGAEHRRRLAAIEEESRTP